MKKTVIIFALILMCALPLFALKNVGLGVQAGIPSGVIVDFNHNDKYNFKAGLGWNFLTKTLDISGSAKYKFDLIGSNSTGTRKMYLSTGPQAAIHIINDFGASLYWLGELSYYLPIDGNQYSAFIDAGPGVKFTKNSKVKFDWMASVGMIVHLAK